MALPELAWRVIFAVAAIPVVVAAVFFGDATLAALLAVTAALAAWEYYRIARAAGSEPLGALGIGGAALLPLIAHAHHLGLLVPLASWAAIALIVIFAATIWLRWPGGHPTAAAATTLFGIFYTGGLLSFAYALRYHEYTLGAIDRGAGAALLLFPLVLTWVSDTGAYAVGRLFGRHKLAPAVSPGKTVEGAIGGLLACALTSWIYARWVLVPQSHLAMLPQTAVLFGVIVSVAVQVGDLVESMIKREAGMKDSSHLIPGHGGVLDRIDGMLFALPAAYWLLGVLRLFPVPG